MTRRPILCAPVLMLAVALAGCGGGGSHKSTAHDADVQTAMQKSIMQVINANVLRMGTTVEFLRVQCIPESDIQLSCVATGSVQGQPLNATWVGVIDPETGKFNVHST